MLQNGVFWMWHGHSAHKVAATGAACERPAQDLYNSKPRNIAAWMDGGGGGGS